MSLITNHRFRNLGYRFHGGGIFPQQLIAPAAVSTSVALTPTLPGRLIPAAAVSTSVANDPSLVFGNVNIAAPVAVSNSVAKDPTVIVGGAGSAIVQNVQQYPYTTGQAITLTAHNLVIASVSWHGGATGGSNASDTITITDSLGNTWTALPRLTSAGILNGQVSEAMRMFYCENCLGGANTVTINGISADSDFGLYLTEVSGILTASSLDTSSTLLSPNSFTAAPTAASITTSAKDFIFVAYADGKKTMGTITAGSGYTLAQKSQSHAAAQEYKTGVVAGTYTPTFALSGTSKAYMIYTLAFKEA